MWKSTKNRQFPDDFKYIYKRRHSLFQKPCAVLSQQDEQSKIRRYEFMCAFWERAMSKRKAI